VAFAALMVVASVLSGARSPLLPGRVATGRARRALAPPEALVPLLVATVAMAAALGAATVSGVALAERERLPAGLPLALMAVGGVIGVLLWSAHDSGLSRRAQLTAGLLVYALAIGATGAAPVLAALALLLLAGAVMAPCDALQAQLCGDAAPASRMAESFAWLNSANWVGFAFGIGGSGSIVDRAGIAAGFLACAVAAVVAAAIIALARRHPGSLAQRSRTAET
jgi:hypothetical protein